MRFLRKLIVLCIGLPFLLVGVILIPLPGPGLVICFLGLMILSIEFDVARGYLDKTKGAFRRIYKEAKARADKIENSKR